jgi:hypothetical protein
LGLHPEAQLRKIKNPVFWLETVRGLLNGAP